MTDERARLGRKEWIKYGLTSGAGTFVLAIPKVLVLLFIALLDSNSRVGWENWFGVFACLAVWDSFVAWVQWLVVGRLRKLRWWVLATVLAGAAIGAPVRLDFLIPSGIALWIWVALVVSLIGVCQWLVLRRYVSRAGWWVLAGALGWVGALGCGLVIIRASV